MKVEIVSLSEKNLVDAPEWDSHPFSCKYCIYWEYPELLIDPAKERKLDMLRKKREWLRHVREEFGECGKLLYIDNRAVGYAQYTPARFLPNATNYPAGPVSGDAVLISCFFIPGKEQRGQGLGGLLLQGILDELRARGIKAAETFARKGNPGNPSGPIEFYLKHGFQIHRDDEEFPLVRLELQEPQCADG